MRFTPVLAASVFFMMPFPGAGQTRVDLRSQSKNVDFSQAQSVRPFRTGTALPAVCNPGEMFFKTDAAPGSNMYGCVATDTWSPEGETDPVTDFEGELDEASNRLTIACRRGSCSVQEGDTVTAFSNAEWVFVPASGTYTAYIYLEGQTLQYGYAAGTMTTCSTTCVQGITEFPASAIPLFTADVLNGVVQDQSLVDRRSRYRAPKRAVPGSNIVISETAGSVTYSSLSNTPLRNQPAGVQPACSAETRGTLWHVNGGSGAKDSITVCAKDGSDTYAWRVIY